MSKQPEVHPHVKTPDIVGTAKSKANPSVAAGHPPQQNQRHNSSGSGGAGSQDKVKTLGGAGGSQDKVKTLEGGEGAAKGKDTKPVKTSGGGKGDGASTRMVKPKHKFTSPAGSDDKFSTLAAHGGGAKKVVKKGEDDHKAPPEKGKKTSGDKGKGTAKPGGGGVAKAKEPGREVSRQSFLRHKGHLQESLQELDHVLSQDLSSKMTLKTVGNDGVTTSTTHLVRTTHLEPEYSQNTSYTLPRRSIPREQKEMDEILTDRHFSEENIDLDQLQERLRAQECEKWTAWIDKAIDTVQINTAILVLIAAMMTAFACYIFVQLPTSIYSTHILYEVFITQDHIINKNGFGRKFGIRNLVPLPAVIVVMYAVLLYFIYLIQYTRQVKWLVFARYCLFVLIEVYLILACLGYGLNLAHVPGRLDSFFKHDQIGLKHEHPGEPQLQKLHFLNRSQEYFGCCGYRNKNEWQQTYPQEYGSNPKTWPLSCCSEDRSGVACYGPVELTVTYFRRNDEDSDEPDMVVKHTKHRLYEESCYDKEVILCETVIALVALLTVIFVVFSSWNIMLFIKLTYIVNKKQLDMKQKEHYIDFF